MEGTNLKPKGEIKPTMAHLQDRDQQLKGYRLTLAGIAGFICSNLLTVPVQWMLTGTPTLKQTLPAMLCEAQSSSIRS